jgi:RNA polymerase sigma factor (sigma-70 family)
MPPPDSELGQWFATHVQPHERMLRAWLHRRFENQLDIDDLVQEAYVRVLRARESGGLTAPKAFLFATARNLALDRLRRHEVSRTDSLGDFDALNVLDERECVSETVAHNQELALLTEAIQSLPARCRQILTLRKLYGLSQREIAERLGLSESTVSNQITIGIEKCTDFFAAHGDGSGSPR